MRDIELHLGFEIGTGKPVSIPLRNMVVTGQTQEAGKTTTLEALISRARMDDISAVAFVTKRGEGAFKSDAHNAVWEIPPYFRERADWQFVASVLEATMREKLKFERSWIIKASKGAGTLKQVQANVKRELVKAKGLTESVYTTLDAYLDIVVPRISQIRWAQNMLLGIGVNVMDISDRELFPMEIQALVIRSVIEWVYEHGTKTITILPEAWEFLPQERGSPVKLAATELIRKGSSLKNYVWLDSQDIGGVDKTILRSCPVWLLGVQRETNEIKRTLDNIPAGIKKPKPEAIATLERGQFFACWGKTVVKTYVQPDWMAHEIAETIARYPERAAHMIEDVHRAHAAKPHVPKEKTKMSRGTTEEGTNDRLDTVIDLLKKSLEQPHHTARIAPEMAFEPGPVQSVDRAPPAPVLAGNGAGAADAEALYVFIRDRLKREAPALIAVMMKVPEIEIREQLVTIETDIKTAFGMLAKMLAEGYFDEKMSASAAWNEMKRLWDYGGSSSRAYEQLDKLTKLGFVTKEAGGYQVVKGMKAHIRSAGR